MLNLVPANDDSYPRPGDPMKRLPRAFRRASTRRRAVGRLLRKFEDKTAARREWRIRDGIVGKMYVAARHGDLSVLRDWLEAGVPPGWDQRYYWYTPIYFAAEANQLEAVKLLFAYGASPWHYQKRIETPLHWAVQKGAVEVIQWLLALGVDPKMGYEHDPLTYAENWASGDDIPNWSATCDLFADAEEGLNAPKVRLKPNILCYRRPPRQTPSTRHDTWLSHVWFVRHTESAANAGEQTFEEAAIALTARGVEQATYLPAAFASPPDLFVTSPALRARQTLAPLLVSFPEVPQAVWPVQEFCYLDPVKARGTTREERRRDVHHYWTSENPHSVAGPGAESFAQLMERVAAFWRQMRENHRGEWVVVAGHGQFIHAALWYWMRPLEKSRLNLAEFRRFSKSRAIANGEIVKTSLGANALWYGYTEIKHLPENLRS